MMKRLITLLMVCAAMAFAAESSVRPEADVATPAEEAGISKDSREFAASDRENWQKMRAERKQAREQILSDLRNRSAEEKNSMRWESEKNRDKTPRFEEGPPKNFDHRQNPNMDRPRFNEPPPMGGPGGGPMPNRGRGQENKDWPPRK